MAHAECLAGQYAAQHNTLEQVGLGKIGQQYGGGGLGGVNAIGRADGRAGLVQVDAEVRGAVAGCQDALLHRRAEQIVAERLIGQPLVVGAIGAGCLAFASRIAATGASSLFAAWVLGAILVIGLGWGWTGLVFLAAIRLDPTRPAKAAGVVLAGLGVGGAAGPASFGATAGQVGWAAAWSLAAGSLALAAILAFAAQRLARGAEAGEHS